MQWARSVASLFSKEEHPLPQRLSPNFEGHYSFTHHWQVQLNDNYSGVSTEFYTIVPPLMRKWVVEFVPDNFRGQHLFKVPLIRCRIVNDVMFYVPEDEVCCIHRLSLGDAKKNEVDGRTITLSSRALRHIRFNNHFYEDSFTKCAQKFRRLFVHGYTFHISTTLVLPASMFAFGPPFNLIGPIPRAPPDNRENDLRFLQGKVGLKMDFRLIFNDGQIVVSRASLTKSSKFFRTFFANATNRKLREYRINANCDVFHPVLLYILTGCGGLFTNCPCDITPAYIRRIISFMEIHCTEDLHDPFLRMIELLLLGKAADIKYDLRDLLEWAVFVAQSKEVRRGHFQTLDMMIKSFIVEYHFNDFLVDYTHNENLSLDDRNLVGELKNRGYSAVSFQYSLIKCAEKRVPTVEAQGIKYF